LSSLPSGMGMTLVPVLMTTSGGGYPSVNLVGGFGEKM